MQPDKVDMNEMDYGRGNEWDGLWTEENKNETWSMKRGLKERKGKEMRWNIKNKVRIEENEMKHEQWSVDWRKWHET